MDAARVRQRLDGGADAAALWRELQAELGVRAASQVWIEVYLPLDPGLQTG
jgi:hypothetical protein